MAISNELKTAPAMLELPFSFLVQRRHNCYAEMSREQARRLL